MKKGQQLDGFIVKGTLMSPASLIMINFFHFNIRLQIIQRFFMAGFCMALQQRPNADID